MIMRVNVDNHVGTSVLRPLNAPDATTADLPANHLVMHQQYIRDRSDNPGSAIILEFLPPIISWSRPRSKYCCMKLATTGSSESPVAGARLALKQRVGGAEHVCFDHGAAALENRPPRLCRAARFEHPRLKGAPLCMPGKLGVGEAEPHSFDRKQCLEHRLFGRKQHRQPSG